MTRNAFIKRLRCPHQNDMRCIVFIPAAASLFSLGSVFAHDDDSDGADALSGGPKLCSAS